MSKKEIKYPLWDKVAGKFEPGAFLPGFWDKHAPEGATHLVRVTNESGTTYWLKGRFPEAGAPSSHNFSGQIWLIHAAKWVDVTALLYVSNAPMPLLKVVPRPLISEGSLKLKTPNYTPPKPFTVQKPVWDGNHRPKIGEVCEVKCGSFCDWVESELMYRSETVIVWRVVSANGEPRDLSAHPHNVFLRPVRTQTERELAALVGVVEDLNTAENVATVLHKLGLRVVEGELVLKE